jgi:D-3-phosphoglycerate dehydrogenase
MNVLIAAPVDTVLTDGLADKGYKCLYHEKITQEKAFDLVRECTGIVTSTRLMLNKELIEAAPKLKWIGRMGSGMEVIDVPYATTKGIACYSSPEGNSNAVGEHAMGLLLSLIHRIAWSNGEVKHGMWLREENRGFELEGKSVGIIGYGHTGRSFASKLAGFDTNILAYDKYYPQRIPSHIKNCPSLDTIFEEADIVSFHVPLQEDTVHMFNEDFIDRMKKPFILINTSRGAVVDTLSLKRGLASGKVSGACLDVFEEEPPINMSTPKFALFSEINALPNVLITPHIAGYTYEALYKMSKVLLDKITTHKQ